MAVCGRRHWRLALSCTTLLLLYPCKHQRAQGGVSSYWNTPRLEALPRKFCCLKKVHPPALQAPRFDSTTLHNFLRNVFKHQERQLGQKAWATDGTSRAKLGSKAAHVQKQNEGSVHKQTPAHPDTSCRQGRVTLSGTGQLEELGGIWGDLQSTQRGKPGASYSGHLNGLSVKSLSPHAPFPWQQIPQVLQEHY